MIAKTIIFALVAMLSSSILYAQQDSVFLWEGDVPGAKPNERVEEFSFRNVLRVKNVNQPMMTIYLPEKEKATGAGVLICPGGGYAILAIEHEGYDVAKWFNEMGIAAFVLKNRLPSDEMMDEKEIRPLMDAQQAMRTIRKNAKAYGVDPEKIGVMGFSAGGHLASTVATHYADKVGGVKDETSLRPDFAVLVYPVVTMQERFTHHGSRRNLLGDRPSQEMLDRYSGELRVTADSPPTFLVHSADDKAVPVENSINYFLALERAGVAGSEMHIYEKGGHGYGLAPGKGDLASWPVRCQAWLKRKGFAN